MATRPRGSGSARTGSKSAGKPTEGSARRASAAAASAGPSAEELDRRDRLKAGPRRQAGPPLSGDAPTPQAMRALREETLPEPTDPRNRRTGR